MNGSDIPKEYLEKAKAEAVDHLLNPNANVVGVGIGKKVMGGQATQKDCVRIYVVYKEQDKDKLSPAVLVPKTIFDVPTDVIQVERFGRNGRPPRQKEDKEEDTTTRPGSPIRVKTNATNVNEGSRGTLGALVTDGKQKYILSCNHILAVNGRVPKDPKAARIVSAEIVGTDPKIAEPGAFVRFRRDGGNSVDCAVARLTAERVPPTFPDGTLTLYSGDVVPPERGMKVQKFGAATGLTHGTIVDVDADLYVDYSFGTFLFEHQVIIEGVPDEEEFASAGDSGSLVVAEAQEKVSQATAMIFAASGKFAVACPLNNVLEELGANLNQRLSLVIR